jgi:uncharacterized repeat protein (TIGR03803 family)
MGRLGLSKTACIVFLFYAATAITSPAQTFKTLLNFNGTNGAQPVYTSLVQNTDGSFYGTTLGGGTNSAGTVFKIAPRGTLITVYSFCEQTNCADGAEPYAGLVRGRDGNFYGTTSSGGANSFGTVFKITSRGTLTTLHSFNLTDGAQPFAALVQATSGDFYGTTTGGGPNNSGTVFKITPAGTLTTLHNFDGTDGSYPLGALVQATNGDFYGTTEYNTVFKISSTGTFTTLHTFNGADGNYPNGLIQAIDGNLYGTTYQGGANNTCNNGCGTVFKITPKGSLTTLHNLDSTHGANPVAVLFQATDGKFYGTTYAGGDNSDFGTIFEITSKGSLATLHTFDGADGGQPYGPLVQSTSGTLYGTTTNFGADSLGTIFSLAVGIGPFVETLPTAGKVGAKVIILGTNLTGVNSVTFNGTPATFKVSSKSEIKTTVPKGATTGTVHVTTPKGILKSNVVFRVTK